MSQIQTCFQTLKENHKKALIPFISAGDPNPEITLPLLHELVNAGADIIELGIPFSDPMADGPVIQRASERALAAGMTLEKIFSIVSQFRQDNTTTPIILMGYLNPIEVMGYQNFAKKAAAAGVNGILTVDMPPEEASELNAALKSQQIDPVYLLAPTTKPDRIQKIISVASGFIYYVSLKGVTGAANIDYANVAEKVATIRQYTDMPLGVGFGISDAESASKIAAIADVDAIVVGSALVKMVEQYSGDQQKIIAHIAALLNSMRQAIDTI